MVDMCIEREREGENAYEKIIGICMERDNASEKMVGIYIEIERENIYENRNE